MRVQRTEKSSLLTTPGAGELVPQAKSTLGSVRTRAGVPARLALLKYSPFQPSTRWRIVDAGVDDLDASVVEGIEILHFEAGAAGQAQVARLEGGCRSSAPLVDHESIVDVEADAVIYRGTEAVDGVRQVDGACPAHGEVIGVDDTRLR